MKKGILFILCALIATFATFAQASESRSFNQSVWTHINPTSSAFEKAAALESAKSSAEDFDELKWVWLNTLEAQKKNAAFCLMVDEMSTIEEAASILTIVRGTTKEPHLLTFIISKAKGELSLTTQR